MTALLEVRGLEVSYDAVRAVRGVDLTVGAGEVIGLLGPNGAGKSSTLRAISRLEAFAGEVRFDGQSLRRMKPDAVARLGVTHVPEGRRLFPNLSAEANLLVGQSGRSGRPARFSLDDVYDLFPALTGLRQRRGWQLSGGEQQMVAIGRGLLASPRLLLLDEPTLGLAPVITQAVMAALESICREVPILIVEQNTRLALKLCERAYVMVGGQIAIAGSREEIENRQDLLDSYLGRRDATEARAPRT